MFYLVVCGCNRTNPYVFGTFYEEIDAKNFLHLNKFSSDDENE